MMEQNPRKRYIEVSADCGFKNIRSFNQSFKKYHHCTPSEYMKKYYMSGMVVDGTKPKNNGTIDTKN